MKIKHILITTTLCMGLSSCASTNTDYKRVGAGALGAGLGGTLAHNVARGNNLAMAIGIIAGYMVGTEVYDRMTNKDKRTLAGLVTRDMHNPNAIGRTNSWVNPETNKIYEYKKTSHQNNCSSYEINVKDRNIDWVIKEQHTACQQNNGRITHT